jgi:DNA-binding transcriptional ArsR family regulator
MKSFLDVLVDRARVLASPTRINILCSIAEDGSRPTDLACMHGVAPSTITYHLTLLRRAKLVEIFGRGISRRYRQTSVKLTIASEAELLAAGYRQEPERS